ncbi:MAG: molybdenum cofactor biosynthesis protein MoaE [Chloroflexi bacterium]|nr:molybdenum cofactor biosynthesis protein MoaE [Chloroflexota bacterium]
MQIKVFLFATLRDRAGAKTISLEIPAQENIAALKQRLAGEYPALAEPLRTCLAAINRQFAFDEDIISDGAEVAFFPPVSGGGELPTVCLIVEKALDLDALLAQIMLPSSGAACIFTGVVRAVTRRGDAHETAYLEYETYREMAEAKLRQVAEEIRAQWPSVEGIAAVQRVGRLEPGTPTVLIACTAAHRDTGVFEAARFGIDRLKEIVPVWKKEVGPRGETWIEGEYIPQRGD